MKEVGNIIKKVLLGIVVTGVIIGAVIGFGIAGLLAWLF